MEPVGPRHFQPEIEQLSDEVEAANPLADAPAMKKGLGSMQLCSS